VLRKHFAVQKTCLHTAYHHPVAQGIKTPYFVKSYKFQEKITLPFVLEVNVGKALISVEDLICGNRRAKADITKDRFLRGHYTYEGHNLTFSRQATK